MAKATTQWVCSNCGHTSPKWFGKCPKCEQFSTAVEEARGVAAPAGKRAVSERQGAAASFVSTADVGDGETFERMSSGLSELDRVLGGGFVPGFYGLLAGEPGAGKALALDTPLPTPAGWTTMGEVQVGDTLFDEEGLPCRVIAASEVMENREVYEVIFDDGSRIVADGDHQWVTIDRKVRRHGPVHRPFRGTAVVGRRFKAQAGNQHVGMFATREEAAVAAFDARASLGISEYASLEPRIHTTRQLAATLRSGDHLNHAIQVAKPLELTENELLVPPYVLGVWLGDGTADEGIVTTADAEIPDFIRSYGYEVRKTKPKYRWSVIGLRVQLRQLGVLGRKHVPAQYLRASEDQRRELLAGLLDTDGTCPKGGTTCEFDNTNPLLADAVYELAVSLGYRASKREDRAVLDGKDCGPTWTVAIQSWDRSLFRLSRKREGWSVGTPRLRRRFVVEVRKIASVSVKCVQVTSPSSLYLAGRAMIPTHNSTLANQMVLAMASAGRRVGIISGEESPEQIKIRLDRLTDGKGPAINVSSETSAERIYQSIAGGEFDLLVVDSINTVFSEEVPGEPGGQQQMRACAAILQRAAKEHGTAVFLVGQVTKDNTVAGPRMLEHAVDAFLIFEGDRREQYRILRSMKNRFGSTDEIGVFEMTGHGLDPVEDPSALFVQARDFPAPGAVVTVVIEGSRPVLCEVQALVNPSNLPMPVRAARGIDPKRSQLLLAVMTRKAHYRKISQSDVFLNIAGGLKVDEPAIDLAICLAVASALTGRPVKDKLCVFGEVTLLGEVRRAMQAERRVNEAQRQGLDAPVLEGSLKDILERCLEAESLDPEEAEDAAAGDS